MVVQVGTHRLYANIDELRSEFSFGLYRVGLGKHRLCFSSNHYRYFRYHRTSLKINDKLQKTYEN